MATLTKGLEITGRYVVHEHVGTGGYGSVWKASDKQLGRDVALKRLLKPVHTSSADETERILEEARKHAKLVHTNIVQVFDVLDVGGEHLIVMEFVDGTSLHQQLRELARKGETMPLDRAVAILRDTLDGVLYAHEQGIVHRDLSPSNILLTQSGIPKLADFGIARAIREPAVTGGTESGTGNPDFMAPEQARGEPADPMSDLFMIGIIGYLLLAGRHPFAHPSGLFAIPELLQDSNFVPEPPRPPSVLTASQQRLFREYASIVMRLLTRERSGRYSTAGEAIDALESVEPTQDCPQCSERVPEHFKFCGHCGFSFTLNTEEVTDSGATTLASAATAEAQVDLGFRAFQRKEWNEAIRLYRAALSIDPQHSKAHLNLGFALNRIRNYKQAEEILTKGLGLANLPAHSKASLLAARAVSRESLKRYDDALSDVEESLALQPQSIRALFTRARVLFLLGRIDQARRDAFEVTRRDPDHNGARRLLSDIDTMTLRSNTALLLSNAGVR